MSAKTCYFAIWRGYSKSLWTTDPSLITDLSKAFEEIKEKIPEVKCEIRGLLTLDKQPIFMGFEIPNSEDMEDFFKVEIWLLNKLPTMGWEILTIVPADAVNSSKYVFRKSID
jgi:hypothetical protein